MLTKPGSRPSLIVAGGNLRRCLRALKPHAPMLRGYMAMSTTGAVFDSGIPWHGDADFCQRYHVRSPSEQSAAIRCWRSSNYVCAIRSLMPSTSTGLYEDLTHKGIKAVILPKSNRRFPQNSQWKLQMAASDRFFGRLKEYRGIAMRCCKTDTSFCAFIAIADLHQDMMNGNAP